MGQVNQHHVAGGALDERADGGLVRLADDQVAFPVPGDGPVRGLGRAFADHHHVWRHARLALVGVPVRSAHGASGAQSAGEFTAQFAARLDVEGLVDRFVGHAHLQPGGEARPKRVADLLRAPLHCQVVLDELA